MGESRLIAVVVIVKDTSKCIASLSDAAMSSNEGNFTFVIGRRLWFRWQYWVQSSVCER